MKQKEIKIKVPPQGSLGLLAIGHRGVIAWRKARAEADKKNADKKSTDKKA